MASKKHKVLQELYKICKRKQEYTFNNKLVKEICTKLDFGNAFDVTKIDNKYKLPESFKQHDIAIVHLGEGNHKFIKGINKIYHDFENIQNVIKWDYKQSMLNQHNSSESNILSVANNQRILHHFLFEKDKEFNDADIIKRPKTYFPHRTKTSFEYSIGDKDTIQCKNIQIEIDLTIEYKGVIGIFEAKNGKPDSFSIYQIFHPFLYYYNISQKGELKGKIKNIYCVYLVYQDNTINLWAYAFASPKDITSIKFIKSSSL